MNNILTEKHVLKFYLEELDRDGISFLKDREASKVSVVNNINKLIDCTSINESVQIAKDLWKDLFEASMSYIDPNKDGYDKLFKYFDEYVNFEELIFASDSFYRDHTLHCLWVYFLGEYIMRTEEFDTITQNQDTFTNLAKKIYSELKSLDMDSSFEELFYIFENMISVEKYFDSVRCISSLCHDLGYPLKKISKINKCIKGVLPYFSINNYNEFNFSYTDVENIFINDFIDLLSTAVRVTSSFDGNMAIASHKQAFDCLIIGDQNNLQGFNKEKIQSLSKDELQVFIDMLKMQVNLPQNKSLHYRYSKDFEEYKHGIMSSFLLMKNVSAFTSFKYLIDTNVNISRFSLDLVKFSIYSDILTSMADHTSDGFKISSINTHSSFLTFIDELEEFSRISRANQNREYVTEFCSSSIYMNEGFLMIDFIFDNTDIDNLDPERAFKGRCERFLKLFNISSLSDTFKIKLNCIGKLPYDNNIYTLEIRKKFAKISINGEEKHIPSYLKSKQFYSREEYSLL